MPAYLIVEVEVHNPQEYENYKKLTPGSLKPYGGKFLVRGGPAELLEGEKQPARIVVVEFPDTESARRWWNSPDYAEAKVLRQRTANTRMMLAEGITSS